MLMMSDKLRRQIAFEAARLMCARQETQYDPARIKAARKVCRGWVKPAYLPSNAEIRDEVRRLAGIYGGHAQLESLIRGVQPDLDLDATPPDVERQADRFHIYRTLLIPLELVEQSRKHHPEGDALYHSLQVFELARDEIPYDEEFQLAALLHDVGKAIDPKDHVAAGLHALEGFITDRTAWLIGSHREALRILDGSIGNRARRRLQCSPDYDELLMLARCDRDGRVPGGPAPELDEALDDLRELARLCG